MAKCYQCKRDIPYLSFWIGCFKHLGKNLFRSKQLPISNCPHCKVPCQETAASSFSFLFVVVIVVFSFMKTTELADIHFNNDLYVLAGVFIFLFIIHNLWWRLISKLREPSGFG